MILLYKLFIKHLLPGIRVCTISDKPAGTEIACETEAILPKWQLKALA